METTDMGTLSRDARHERRVQVIRLRKAGLGYEAIAAQTGLSRTGVFNICKRHAQGGAKALRDAVGGRKVGEFRVLTAAQERQVRQLMRDKTPDQIKLPYALWSRAAVAELIADRFGIRVPVRTMGTYLKRWIQGCRQEDVSDSGQPEGTSQQAGESVASQARGCHRGVLSAQLQPGQCQ